MNQVVAQVVAWSLRCAAEGKFPTQGFYGEALGAGTARSKLAGKQIAGGFKHLVSFVSRVSL